MLLNGLSPLLFLSQLHQFAVKHRHRKVQNGTPLGDETRIYADRQDGGSLKIEQQQCTPYAFFAFLRRDVLPPRTTKILTNDCEYLEAAKPSSNDESRARGN